MSRCGLQCRASFDVVRTVGVANHATRTHVAGANVAIQIVCVCERREARQIVEQRLELGDSPVSQRVEASRSAHYGWSWDTAPRLAEDHG